MVEKDNQNFIFFLFQLIFGITSSTKAKNISIHWDHQVLISWDSAICYGTKASASRNVLKLAFL